MAITLNCNLNGGDAETPNNELYYRIYGDIDSYASPIHTTGTAIADATVTVNADVVVITGVAEGVNTSFKIAAVDEVGNEGILSDAFTFTPGAFSDDFAGTTIDTSKWTLTNPDTVDIDYTQNDELIITSKISDGSGGTGSEYVTNHLVSKGGLPASGIVILKFDVTRTEFSPSSVQNSYFGVSTDGSYTTGFFHAKTDASKAKMLEFDGGALGENTDTAGDFEGSWKIVKLANGGVTYYRWGGSSWTSVGAFTTTITTGTFNVWLAANCTDIGGATPSTWNINDLVFTDTDFSGLNPA